MTVLCLRPEPVLAPPTSLSDWCHLWRAFINQVFPRWLPLSLLDYVWVVIMLISLGSCWIVQISTHRFIAPNVFHCWLYTSWFSPVNKWFGLLQRLLCRPPCFVVLLTEPGVFLIPWWWIMTLEILWHFCYGNKKLRSINCTCPIISPREQHFRVYMFSPNISASSLRHDFRGVKQHWHRTLQN